METFCTSLSEVYVLLFLTLLTSSLSPRVHVGSTALQNFSSFYTIWTKYLWLIILPLVALCSMWSGMRRARGKSKNPSGSSKNSMHSLIGEQGPGTQRSCWSGSDKEIPWKNFFLKSKNAYYIGFQFQGNLHWSGAFKTANWAISSEGLQKGSKAEKSDPS